MLRHNAWEKAIISGFEVRIVAGKNARQFADTIFRLLPFCGNHCASSQTAIEVVSMLLIDNYIL